MSKILIGWLAKNNDFKTLENEGTIVNKEHSPNYQFHKHFYKHDKHLILHTAKDKLLAGMLHTAIKEDFKNHEVELVELNILDPISLTEIKPKVENELMKIREHEIDIFFSPGTSIMQVSWFICHTSLNLNSRLIQTRAGRFTSSGDPEMSEIGVEKSNIPYSAVLREESEEGRRGDSFPDKIHRTETIQQVYDRAYKIAQTDKVTCLITGPSGSGKENLASFIHENSPRKDEKYLAVNCSALSDQLLESHLFGYKKGAFTGADKDTPGIFDELDKGTIFLDEIGDISAYMQQSLLRVLQEGSFIPLGGHEEKKIDVRVIAATNRDLKKRCEEGKFRWDLYYRLAVVDLYVPSLAECGPDEVDELFEHFLDLKQKKLGKANRLKPSKEVIQAIKNYPFPGNIRELENLTEKLYVFCDEKIELTDLPSHITDPDESISLKIEDVEKRHIEKVLKMKHYNQRQTALAIGWVINTLKSKMERYGIEVGEE